VQIFVAFKIVCKSRPSFETGPVKQPGKKERLPEGALNQRVPRKGIEPSHPYGRQILSLLRLPIPPPGLMQAGGKPDLIRVAILQLLAATTFLRKKYFPENPCDFIEDCHDYRLIH
jgi:hypothetical protein